MTTQSINRLILRLLDIEKQQQAGILLLESALLHGHRVTIANLRAHQHRLLDEFMDIKAQLAAETRRQLNL